MKTLNVDSASTSGHAVHTQRPRYLPLSETKYAHLIGKPMTEGQAALVVYGPELQAERDRLLAVNKTLMEAVSRAKGEFMAISLMNKLDLSEAIAGMEAALKAGKGE